MYSLNMCILHYIHLSQSVTACVCDIVYLLHMHVVSVSVSIQVLSRREGTFRVTCTATGGTVLTSSFSGPGGVDLVLQPVGTVGRTGQNTYSVTSGTISGRSNGDTYLCTATNGVSSPAPSDSAVLAGIVYTMSCVSMVVVILSGFKPVCV